jgi:hypothetical protein
MCKCRIVKLHIGYMSQCEWLINIIGLKSKDVFRLSGIPICDIMVSLEHC